MILFLRAFGFSLFFLIWTLVFAIVFSPFLLLPRSMMIVPIKLWARGLLKALKVFCRIDHQIEGLHHLPDTPCLIAAKHQSMWETMMLMLLLPDAAFVLKQELFWIPIYGWYAKKCGMIAINRKGGANALRQMLAKAAGAIQEGRFLVIFPEGTRVRPGENKIFHPGVYALAHHLELPTIPVAVNSGLFWRKRQFMKKPGRITLRFLPPLMPPLDGREAFLGALQTSINQATEDLLANPLPVDKKEE